MNSIPSIPSLKPPALFRDSDGHLIAIRTLPDHALSALGRFLIEEEADLHLAIVQDALAQGATEDEARALLDIEPEKLRLHAEPVWFDIFSEIARRNLPHPIIPSPPARDLAEIEGLLRRVCEIGRTGPPLPLERALSARATIQRSGRGRFPLAWIDLIRRHNGLSLGGLTILSIDEIINTMPIPGWGIFGLSGRGTILHATNTSGTCAAWPLHSLTDGLPTGNPVFSAPDFVSYLENLLPRVIEIIERKKQFSET